MNYIIGLDVGIGSVGWAAVNLDKRRIEDCGVRIFETGENRERKASTCTERREARGIRRLVRRKSHRKSRLKKHLEYIELTTENKINEYFAKGNSNVIAVRVKALSEKVTPEELTACLIHICNHRGYRDFYSTDSLDDLSGKEKEETEKDAKSLERVKKIMSDGHYRTPAEMIYSDPEFAGDGGEIKKYRNSGSSENNNLIPREMLQSEVKMILEKQREFYPVLTDDSIGKIIDIIFSQRNFEDGPGDKNDEFRKYTGFLDSIGKCRFYSDENRGSRFTVIADVYAMVNTLSQYKYFDKNGDFCFTADMAHKLVSSALEKGRLTRSDIKKIVGKFGVTINEFESSDKKKGSKEKDTENDKEIAKCFKYLKNVKPLFEKAGYDPNELIRDYTDTENNILNKVGITLSRYITPSVRIGELRKLLTDEKLIKDLARLKFSGTTSVSYRYMTDSINAFLEGDIYGKYQAAFVKENSTVINENDKPKKLPPFKNEDDCEFYKNPVVFRAINETRKVINALIDKYGYPCAVNIETADEISRAAADRDKETFKNKENEKKNDEIKQKISELTDEPVESVRPVQIERYKLWEAQGGKCLYSGEPINVNDILRENCSQYEIDHIVPYSLILDNTLNNKALVRHEENQTKGQRTPLMYMTSSKQIEDFRTRVNEMLKAGRCGKKKYRYLMLEDLKNSELLDEWKSRNLNDTRYISKYLVNYLRNNLRFNPKNEFEDGFKIAESRRVFAVKSKFTSYFRKQWLNKNTWGRDNKDELKKITYLDHAADAIVIANCRPEYVIISGEKLKLYGIYKNAGKHITDEYRQSFNECVENLERFYGIDKNFSTKLLKDPSSRLTPLIPNISLETDNRLRDFNTHRLIYDAPDDTDEQIINAFKSNNLHNYGNDTEFAKSLKMPVISYKPERAYSGEITAANPISVKEIDGKLYQVSRKKVSELKAEELNDIRSDDRDLTDSLKAILDGKGKGYTVDKYLTENGLPYFTTLKGRRINKVTVLKKAPERYYIKNISENNRTVMDNKNYYCLEIYKTTKGKNGLQGITRTDVVNVNGKLYLKPDYKYPDDYSKHVMYLFKGDYIQHFDNKNKVDFCGYYMSVKNINKKNIYVITDNSKYQKNATKIEPKIESIKQTGRYIKLNVGILGEVTGYNNGEGISCGEPLSLQKAKE